MRIGVAFPTTEIGNDPSVIRDFVQTAEELGYAHLTCIDHVVQAGTAGADWQAYYTRENAFHEPLILFGFVAAVTKRIELAPAVLILPQRQAALVAKQAAELDLLSGGRLRLGVGLGWNAVEYEALGQDFASRARRFEEQIAVLRALWSKDLVTFKGQFHSLSDVGLNPTSLRRPLPLWMGAFETRAIARAGRLADGWFLNPRLVPGAEAEALIAAFRLAAREAGRDPETLGMDATLHIGGKTSEQIADEIEAWRRHGATHVTLRTIYSGLTSPAEHIATIRKLRDALPKD